MTNHHTPLDTFVSDGSITPYARALTRIGEAVHQSKAAGTYELNLTLRWTGTESSFHNTVAALVSDIARMEADPDTYRVLDAQLRGDMHTTVHYDGGPF